MKVKSLLRMAFAWGIVIAVTGIGCWQLGVISGALIGIGSMGWED